MIYLRQKNTLIALQLPLRTNELLRHNMIIIRLQHINIQQYAIFEAAGYTATITNELELQLKNVYKMNRSTHFSTASLSVVFTVLVAASCTKTLTRLNTDESVIAAITSTDSTFVRKDSIPLPLPEKERPLSSGRHIYLTIDDAPLNGSKYIDSIITETRVKTNIFMVGNPIHGSRRFKEYHEILKENRYIELYNHSYSHANHKYARYYKNPKQVVADFEKNKTEFQLHHDIVRLPGRNLWQLGDRKKNYKQSGAEAAALLAEKGYKIFGWDVEWKYDPKTYAPVQTIEELVEEIDRLCRAENTVAFTPHHVVLLMHDQMFAKITEENDLTKLIRELKAAGYRFEYLSDYPDTE